MNIEKLLEKKVDENKQGQALQLCGSKKNGRKIVKIPEWDGVSKTLWK